MSAIIPGDIFELPLADLQPSQLYISEGKLRRTREWFDAKDKSVFDPIPIKLYKNRYMMTDGHTRAVMANIAGWETVPVIWDDDPLDMLAYGECVRWCDEAGISSASDLTKRIISSDDYDALWLKRCAEMRISPTYAAIVARFCGLDARHRVVILTDDIMDETAKRIQKDSAPFVKSIDVINLDRTDDYNAIYLLESNDLLILHIGIDSWMGKHRNIACAFDKPEGIQSKYICIRPTVTAQALLEGLNTPLEAIADVLSQYGSLRDEGPVRVTAKSGTDISLIPCEPFHIAYLTHAPGSNAYLPPAEISYSVKSGSSNGIIIADVTVGELRVYADLIDSFGLVDEAVALYVENGEIVDVIGGNMAQKLKSELWKLPTTCRKIVELGIGLSRMTPTGIIGIDESIAGTCHFGIGNGSGNDAPIHLDVVVNDFSILF